MKTIILLLLSIKCFSQIVFNKEKQPTKYDTISVALLISHKSTEGVVTVAKGFEVIKTEDYGWKQGVNKPQNGITSSELRYEKDIRKTHVKFLTKNKKEIPNYWLIWQTQKL